MKSQEVEAAKVAVKHQLGFITPLLQQQHEGQTRIRETLYLSGTDSIAFEIAYGQIIRAELSRISYPLIYGHPRTEKTFLKVDKEGKIEVRYGNENAFTWEWASDPLTRKGTHNLLMRFNQELPIAQALLISRVG